VDREENRSQKKVAIFLLVLFINIILISNSVVLKNNRSILQNTLHLIAYPFQSVFLKGSDFITSRLKSYVFLKNTYKKYLSLKKRQSSLIYENYLLKKELLWIPFFGWGLAANEPIAIDRGKKTQALQQLIAQGKERLKQRRWIIIFPEGTRRPVGQPGTFQVGGAFIASKTGAPVVPVAHNAGVFWSKQNSFNKKPGTVEVVIGPTIETKGRKPRDINLQAEEWILHTMQELPITPFSD